MLLSPITHDRKNAYIRDTGDSCHLYFVVSVVVRIVRLGFCCSLDSSAKEEDALRTKAPNEDALIPSRRFLLPSQGWILPSGRGWIFLSI